MIIYVVISIDLCKTFRLLYLFQYFISTEAIHVYEMHTSYMMYCLHIVTQCYARGLDLGNLPAANMIKSA